MTKHRPPPYNQEAEEATLGSIMIDPDSMSSILGETRLEPEDFYLSSNQIVFRAMRALVDNDQPIDIVSLQDRIKQDAPDPDTGEPLVNSGYLIGLLNAVPTSINAISYARMVTHYSDRRILIRTAGEIAGLGYNMDQAVEEVITQAGRLVLQVQSRRRKNPVRTMQAVARSLLDEVQRASERDEFTGVPTGFKDMDRLLGGGTPSGDLLLVAARPGMGKTSLLTSLALNAALKHNRKIALFTMEMRAEQLLQRMIATQTGIDTRVMRTGKLADREWPMFMEALGQISEAPIWVIDGRQTPGAIRHMTHSLWLDHGIDQVMVDYIQLMVPDVQHHGNRVQELSDIGKSLKTMAIDMNISVIAAAQLSRAVEQRQDKHPILSDLRDSGTLEEDSDTVAFIYRDEYYNPNTTERPNIAEIDFAKQRNGPTGTIDLYWNGKRTVFSNLERRRIDLTHAAVTESSYGD